MTLRVDGDVISITKPTITKVPEKPGSKTYGLLRGVTTTIAKTIDRTPAMKALSTGAAASIQGAKMITQGRFKLGLSSVALGITLSIAALSLCLPGVKAQDDDLYEGIIPTTKKSCDIFGNCYQYAHMYGVAPDADPFPCSDPDRPFVPGMVKC